MPKIKVGMIGGGFIGNIHAASFNQISDAELVAVATSSPETAAQFAKAHQIPHSYGDFHEMIRHEDIDAVIVGLPNYLHVDAVVSAAEAGKHILCEKPFAKT